MDPEPIVISDLSRRVFRAALPEHLKLGTVFRVRLPAGHMPHAQVVRIDEDSSACEFLATLEIDQLLLVANAAGLTIPGITSGGASAQLGCACPTALCDRENGASFPAEPVYRGIASLLRHIISLFRGAGNSVGNRRIVSRLERSDPGLTSAASAFSL